MWGRRFSIVNVKVIAAFYEEVNLELGLSVGV
jgi:hypothetical protein